MIAATLLVLSASPLAFARPGDLGSSAKRAECTTTSVRKSWLDLTAAEKQSYIDADLCLMSLPAKSGIPGATTRWDELQYTHAAQTRYVHSVGAFLPFHRYFVTVHESLIRNECGYTGPLPYWEEPVDSDDILSSALFSGDEPNFGGNGTGSDNCVADGPFADLVLHFKEDLSTTDYCLSRAMSNQQYSSATQENADECLAAENFIDAWGCLEWKPHAAGHGGVGGTMINLLLSPGDPVFYLHHAWIDRVWWEWQTLDLSTRLYEIGGNNTPSEMSMPGGGGGDDDGSGPIGGGVVDLPDANPAFEDYFNDGGSSTTTLNHTLWSAGILPNATIADVMDVRAGIVCAEYVF